MSRELYRRMCEEFPPVVPYETERVSIYGAHERTHVTLYDIAFTNLEGPVLDEALLEEIAKEVFDDIPFEPIWEDDDGHWVIWFDPKTPDKYSQKYYGHDILVQNVHATPMITIETGWRGDGGLTDRQRDKYIQFVKEVHRRCVEKAEEIKG